MISRNKYLLIGAPIVAGVAMGAVAVILVRRHRRHKRGRFMPEDVRGAMEDMLKVQASEFTIGELGQSLFQRKLEKMTDKQLITLFALVEVGRLVRSRGIDVRRPSAVEIDAAKREFDRSSKLDISRESLISRLGELNHTSFINALRSAFAILQRAE